MMVADTAAVVTASAATRAPRGLTFDGFRALAVGLVLTGRVAARVLSWPPLYLGAMSSGIHIVHTFIPETIQIVERHFRVSRHFLPEGFERFLLISAMSVAAAAVSWTFFESPLNRMKRYVPYLPLAAAAQS